LNFTHVEYPVGEYEAVGKPAAELLFPTLDYVLAPDPKNPETSALNRGERRGDPILWTLNPKP